MLDLEEEFIVYGKWECKGAIGLSVAARKLSPDVEGGIFCIELVVGPQLELGAWLNACSELLLKTTRIQYSK